MELSVNGSKKEEEEEQEMGKKRKIAEKKKSPKTGEVRKGFIDIVEAQWEKECCLED